MNIFPKTNANENLHRSRRSKMPSSKSLHVCETETEHYESERDFRSMPGNILSRILLTKDDIASTVWNI